MPESADNIENEYSGWDPEQVRLMRTIEYFRHKIEETIDNISCKLDRATEILDAEIAAVEAVQTKQ
jgi:hypothetical protein